MELELAWGFIGQQVENFDGTGLSWSTVTYRQAKT
jgi:hypothetical protein